MHLQGASKSLISPLDLMFRRKEDPYLARMDLDQSLRSLRLKMTSHFMRLNLGSILSIQRLRFKLELHNHRRELNRFLRTSHHHPTEWRMTLFGWPVTLWARSKCTPARLIRVSDTLGATRSPIAVLRDLWDLVLLQVGTHKSCLKSEGSSTTIRPTRWRSLI